MKIFRVLLIALVFSIVTASTAHKFYVSTTKIEYVEQQQSVQIISKIFIDDLEEVLRKRYDESIVLDSKDESEQDFVKRYLLQKLQITINGIPATLEYIGKEYEIDVIKVYFEINDIIELNTIEIENIVLLDLFEEQQNIIHLKTGESRRSLVLNKENPKGMLNFD
jgi:hypothetical protein